MAKYRISRNIEKSIIDFLTAQLEENNWSDIIIEKSFIKAIGLQLNKNKSQAVICVRVSDTHRDRVEIGTDGVLRASLVLIDIFSTNDGQRLDLVDFIGSILIGGMEYYEYEISEGEIESKIQNGRIQILKMEDKPVNFNMDKSDLEVQDRYRHLFNLTVSLGRIEV